MVKRKIEKMTQSYSEWVVESLESEEEVAAYLQVAFDEFQADGDVEAFLLALREVAEARGGLGALARKTHLNRESLYKTLSSKGNPKLQTMSLILNGLGFKLSISPQTRA